MNVVADQKFENTMLTLDDTAFYRCHLVDCQLLFGGGDVVLQDCTIERCQVRFFGPAARTVNLLPALGWSYSPPHDRLP
jgi:hypothetical protein